MIRLLCPSVGDMFTFFWPHEWHCSPPIKRQCESEFPTVLSKGLLFLTKRRKAIDIDTQTSCHKSHAVICLFNILIKYDYSYNKAGCRRENGYKKNGYIRPLVICGHFFGGIDEPGTVISEEEEMGRKLRIPRNQYCPLPFKLPTIFFIRL